jgi:hypothetical protein
MVSKNILLLLKRRRKKFTVVILRTQYKLLSYVRLLNLFIDRILMLSKREAKFLEYWELNREKERSLVKQFFPGLPIGLALAAAILLLLDSGWYVRANMVAQSQSSPLVIFIGIAAIVAFTGFFYKRHRWEMNEQTYKELKLKEEKEKHSSL